LAVVLARDDKATEIWIDDPPVLARAAGIEAEPGEVIEVEVEAIEVDSGNIRFSRTD